MGTSITTAGLDVRANAGHGQKARRPDGFTGKGRLASLLLGQRPLRVSSLVAPRHPAFSAKTGLPRNFKQALKRLRSLESRPGQVLTSATPIQANPRALPILTECLGIC